MDKPLRLNSEKKVDNQYFDVKIGTVSRLNPRAIYVEGKTFIKPLEKRDDYQSDISLIRHTLKNKLNNELRQNKLFEQRFILDFDIASSCVKYSKNSYLFFQVTMKQKNNPPIKLDELKSLSENMITNVVDTLSNAIMECNFTMKKKKG